MLPQPSRAPRPEDDYPAWLVRFTRWMARADIGLAVTRICAAFVALAALWIGGRVAVAVLL